MFLILAVSTSTETGERVVVAMEAVRADMVTVIDAQATLALVLK